MSADDHMQRAQELLAAECPECGGERGNESEDGYVRCGACQGVRIINMVNLPQALAAIAAALSEAQGREPAASVGREAVGTFTNDGGSEAQFIADGARLNCPRCGGSGHVDDTHPAAVVEPPERIVLWGRATNPHWFFVAKKSERPDCNGAPVYETLDPIVLRGSPEAVAAVVDEAMVERGLRAAESASDARLPRHKVVHAVLTAALSAPNGGEG